MEDTSPIVICISLPDAPAPGDADNNAATVEEGQDAVYKLTASRAPTTDLTVHYSVTIPDRFRVTGFVPVAPTISSGTTTADVIIPTAGDALDEANGDITVELLDGTGYVVGTPSSAVVTVKDDDMPPVPTGLRINGHQDADGNVTLRWADHEGFGDDTTPIRFDVLHALETCDDDGDCVTGPWILVEDITTRPTTVENTREAILPLPANMLYRVHLLARIVDASDGWSDLAMVFASARTRGEAATIKIHSFQTNGRWDYKVCNPGPPVDEDDPRQIPAPFSVPLMISMVQEWESAVKWQRADDQNIIGTSGQEITGCSGVGFLSQNVIMFQTDNAVKRYCDERPGYITLACFSQTGSLLTASVPRAVLIRASYDKWANAVSTGECTFLRRTLVHEVGHALGLGHGIVSEALMTVLDNRRESICGPMPYDVTAMMAAYQSR